MRYGLILRNSYKLCAFKGSVMCHFYPWVLLLGRLATAMLSGHHVCVTWRMFASWRLSDRQLFPVPVTPGNVGNRSRIVPYPVPRTVW